MKLGSAFAVALIPLALGASARAEPVVPGFSVERYAAVAWPAWLSFDRDSGELFAGVESGAPERIWRIGAGGEPVSPYGAVPILDPDAVLCDAAGLMTGVAGSVLVGGRGGGAPQIWAILPDKMQSVVGVFGPSSAWTNISDMEFDGSGRFLFGDEDGHDGRVLVTSSPGEFPQELFAVDGRVAGLEVDAAGRIYTSTFDGMVRIHAPDGGVISDPLLAGLGDRILPIALGPGGPWGTDLYTVNQYTGELVRADMSADTTVVGTGFGGFLVDFEFGPDGALYVSDLGLGTIWRISPLQSTAVDALPAGPDPRPGPQLRVMHANPMRPPATLRYEVPVSGRALLEVYDVRGRVVRMLVSGWVGAGIHTASWDGRDAAGRRVPAGVYVYRLATDLDTRASKVVLVP